MADRTCSEVGCDRPHNSRGLCRMHYMRLRNSGRASGGRTCSYVDCTRSHYGRGWCRLHYDRARANGGDPAKHRPAWFESWTRTDAKPCTECGEVKDLDEYAPNSMGFLGRANKCRPCFNRYQNVLIEKTPGARERRREYSSRPEVIAAQRMHWVRRTYGPVGVALEERRVAGDPCDVCGEVTPAMSLDHCHVSGVVRGLLCRNCNWALGKVQDDPVILRALADYVENHRRAQAERAS